LWEDSEGMVHGAATDDAAEVAGQAAGVERRTAAAHAHAHPGTGSVSALGPAGAFPILRSTSERPSAMCFPCGSGSPVADGVEPSQPRPSPAMAPYATLYRTVASDGFDLSSLSHGAPRRHDPRWEPDAVVPLVRICGGGHERSWSLLRLGWHRSWLEECLMLLTLLAPGECRDCGHWSICGVPP
jgi:hypothetical protein